MAPFQVSVVPDALLKMPVALSVAVLVVVKLAVVCKVPPPNATPPLAPPRLLLVETATVPPLIERPPVKVLVLLRVIVPVPTLTSEAPVPPKSPPSLMVPLTAVERLLPPTVSWLAPRL